MRAVELFLFLEKGRSITIYPQLVNLFGGLCETVFLLNLIQWLPADNPEREIYKTANEIQDETGLSREQQRTARKNLKALGVLREQEKRIEHRIYYQIDLENLNSVIESAGDTDPNPEVGKSQPGSGKTPTPKSGNPNRYNEQESTTRELQESTNIRPILELPDWLDVETWEAYKAHRSAMPKKSHLSPRAESLALKRLAEWHDKGHDPNEILRTSIINGWIGLFEPRNGGPVTQREGELSERTQRILRRGL